MSVVPSLMRLAFSSVPGQSLLKMTDFLKEDIERKIPDQAFFNKNWNGVWAFKRQSIMSTFQTIASLYQTIIEKPEGRNINLAYINKFFSQESKDIQSLNGKYLNSIFLRNRVMTHDDSDIVLEQTFKAACEVSDVNTVLILTYTILDRLNIVQFGFVLYTAIKCHANDLLTLLMNSKLFNQLPIRGENSFGYAICLAAYYGNHEALEKLLGCHQKMETLAASGKNSFSHAVRCAARKENTKALGLLFQCEEKVEQIPENGEYSWDEAIRFAKRAKKRKIHDIVIEAHKRVKRETE